MGLLDFFTGHNAKEADVYAHFDKVSTVVDSLNEVATTDVSNAETEILSAIERYNRINGVGSYLPPIDTSICTGATDYARSQITSLVQQMEDKADAIKTYSEASLAEKIFATGEMVTTKLCEGFLSVFENLGDGVVSAIGWLAPKDSGLEQACASFVEKSWSHDLFNGFYQSEFAKMSAITENSFLAGVAKFGGQMGGFAVTACGISALAGHLGKGAGMASKVFNAVAGTQKRINVSEAVLMGMGLGTEGGLKTGLSMDEAAWQGAKSGAVAGALAWGISTLAEKWAARKASKKATELFQNQGDDALESVENQLGRPAAEQQKLLPASEERLALPGEFADGTPVGSDLSFQQKLAKDYVDDLPQMLDKGVSAEQYFELKGERVLQNSTRAEAGALYGDANGEMYSIVDRVGSSTGIKQKYLNQIDRYIDDISGKPSNSIDLSSAEYRIKSIFREAGLDGTQQEQLWGLYKYKIKTGPTTDTTGLYDALKSYMTEDETARISSLLTGDNYTSRMVSGATQAQREAAYVYTKNGYEEMNSLLTNDAKGYYARYYGAHGTSTDDMLREVYQSALGNSDNALSSCSELERLVSNNRVQENVVVYRSVRDFGGLSRVKQLTAGSSFTNQGFTSATASAEDFANIMGQLPHNNIQLQILIPKGSPAAYIEPFSGIPGYFQNEVLINPNSHITIIENAFQEKVGNRLITIVKCILN